MHLQEILKYLYLPTSSFELFCDFYLFTSLCSDTSDYQKDLTETLCRVANRITWRCSEEIAIEKQPPEVFC